MASIVSVMTGSFIAAPGSGAHIIEMQPGRFGVLAMLAPASSADAGQITFGTQHADADPWPGTVLYHMEWDSVATTDVQVNYWLLIADAAIAHITYGGA